MKAEAEWGAYCEAQKALEAAEAVRDAALEAWRTAMRDGEPAGPDRFRPDNAYGDN